MSEIFMGCVLLEILGKSKSLVVLRMNRMNPLVYPSSSLYISCSFVILMQIGVVEVQIWVPCLPLPGLVCAAVSLAL
jgi:hypothetical protein